MNNTNTKISIWLSVVTYLTLVQLLILQKLDMVSKKDECRTVNNTYYIICHCNNNNNNDYKKGNKKLWESGGKGQLYVKLKS